MWLKIMTKSEYVRKFWKQIIWHFRECYRLNIKLIYHLFCLTFLFKYTLRQDISYWKNYKKLSKNHNNRYHWISVLHCYKFEAKWEIWKFFVISSIEFFWTTKFNKNMHMNFKKSEYLIKFFNCKQIGGWAGCQENFKCWFLRENQEEKCIDLDCSC